MNFQQFQYVLAVVDSRNFELAAERCFVTQSTLSTMIGRLEEEIGVRIFNRKTKPVSVTPEGEQIIERLRIVLNEIEIMKNLVQELKGEMAGELRLGIIPTIAPSLIPLFLSEFAADFPKVNIVVKEMTTPEIQQALTVRELDIGILAIPLEDNEFNELHLYEEPFLVYSCEPGKRAKRVSVESINYSKLCLLQEGHCLRTQVQELCEMSDRFAQRDVNFEFESGSMDSLLRITKIRKGLTILPHLATLDLPKEEKGRLSAFKAPVPTRQVGLVTHKYFVKTKLLERLQTLIQAKVSGLLPTTSKSRVLQPLDVKNANSL